jgi:hypothetical protein
MRLDDWPLPYLRLKCARCSRDGKLDVEKLIERFGPDQELFIVRDELSRNGCKSTGALDPCHSILPDALLVDAILETDESRVIDQSKIPEAKEWRTKLGINV